jgi:hypothetical protein
MFAASFFFRHSVIQEKEKLKIIDTVNTHGYGLTFIQSREDKALKGSEVRIVISYFVQSNDSLIPSKDSLLKVINTSKDILISPVEFFRGIYLGLDSIERKKLRYESANRSFTEGVNLVEYPAIINDISGHIILYRITAKCFIKLQIEKKFFQKRIYDFVEFHAQSSRDYYYVITPCWQ